MHRNSDSKTAAYQHVLSDFSAPEHRFFIITEKFLRKHIAERSIQQFHLRQEVCKSSIFFWTPVLIIIHNMYFDSPNLQLASILLEYPSSQYFYSGLFCLISAHTSTSSIFRTSSKTAIWTYVFILNSNPCYRLDE